MIGISKGDCEEIAKDILNQYRKNSLQVAVRMGSPNLNLIAMIIYKDKNEVFEMMQHIKRMDHVESVEWSEIVKTVLENDSGILKAIFN